MRRTALVTILMAGLAVPAIAQETGSSDPAPQQEQQQAPYITATMLQDARIVSLEGEYDAGTWDGGEPLQPILAGLSEIGDVSEILLDDAGQVQGITTDIGGFIGIGQKTVMIPLADLRLARSPDDEDITIVTRLGKEQLEQAPEFQTAED
ncbi:photosystem reaction center subunit H [Roseivivax halodurans JCM 10272]|uniref:Photosystem reaction center subunit H n=1 Tax=Roseivivax halodurans JCM 10272 TaxID=1449350 RepID=X7EJ84_9RHOB|nr:PRC-barrel domain-containing protein [Roseivivax halodurans]ETX15226.1 photosystem reaction center subunit H [Roseivivax halodurans JCM 10272]